MFTSLFKPKWQHGDPQVRRQAVQQLRADEGDVLRQIAREDVDAGVRQAALKRIVDLDLLWNCAQSDADEGVRELARARFLRVLGGEDIGPEDLSARTARLQAITDIKLIEHFARHAVERTLRAAAQQRIDRDALLGDIALGDPDAELRVQAANRITQKSTLERVAKAARGKDKRVHGVVRDKLNELQEREELPGRLLGAARAVCAALEALPEVQDIDSIPARRAPGVAEWLRVQEQWRAAQLGEFDAEVARRYADAAAAIDARLARHAEALEQQRALDAHHADLAERKRQVCEQLETQLAELNARAEPADDDATLRQLVNTMNAVWTDIEALPPEQEMIWAHRFKRVSSELSGYAEQSAQWRAEASALRDVLADAQRLLANDRAASAKQIDALERRARDTRSGRHADLRAQVTDAVAALKARQAESGERSRAQRAAVEALVRALEEHIAEGRTADAHIVQRQAQEAMDALGERELGALRGAGVVGRFTAAAKQLREWDKWKRWAGKPVKEELVATMEGLVREIEATAAKDLDHRDVAEHVRLAREQWKRLGPTENAGPLWKRFDAACTAAYAPCAARFDKEREQRQANAARLGALCDELQQFLSGTDWENPDWSLAERKLRDATRHWERPGAIERGPRKALDARFKALSAELEQKLHKERTRNKFKKEALIKRAKQLVASIAGANVDGRAVNDAINKARDLQEEWKRIGVSTDVQPLWEQFRAELDAVFNRRKVVYEEQDQQRAENLTRKQALCATIEECAQLEGDAATGARGKVAAAKSEFQGIGQVPRDAEKKLRARFERAVRDFERRLADLAAQQQRAQEDARKRKASLCTALEAELDRAAGALDLEPQAIVQAADNAEQAWQTEPALENALESKLRARLNAAIALARTMGGGEREATVAQLRQRQQQQRSAAEELCLRLEIATGAESPPDQREARMQYQVQRLARKLGGADAAGGHADEVAAIHREWMLIGPLSGADRSRLDARFAQARKPE